MIRHGQRRRGKYTKEYAAWNHMRQRCNNSNHPRYSDYGGRGITVCEQWKSFAVFLTDVGFAPSPKHTLDRYPNNNGNYETGNVRWATIEQQNVNKRSNTVAGKSLCQISIELGGHRTLVGRRLKAGWPLDKAMTTPTATKLLNERDAGKQTETI